MPLTVYEYNIRKQMKRDSSVLWIGARRSGKTYSVRHCVYEMKFKRILAMAGSADCEEFHEQYIPRSYVFGEYNESKMEEIFLYQRHLKNMQKRGEDVDMELAIVIDDFGFDDKVMKSKSLTNCYQNGRNYGLWVGVTVQYGTQFQKKLRGNIDVVFIFEERSRDNRLNLYKQYTSTFSSFDQFNDYMDACTQDGQAMVIDNTIKSNKTQDRVFWYKPLFDLPSFTAGDKGFVAYDHVHYQPEEEDESYDDSFIGVCGGNKGSHDQQPLRQNKQSKPSKRELMKQSLFETPLACATEFNLRTACANFKEEATTAPTAWDHLDDDNNTDFGNTRDRRDVGPPSSSENNNMTGQAKPPPQRHPSTHHRSVGMGKSTLMASWKTVSGNRIQLQSTPHPDLQDNNNELHDPHPRRKTQRKDTTETRPGFQHAQHTHSIPVTQQQSFSFESPHPIKKDQESEWLQQQQQQQQMPRSLNDHVQWNPNAPMQQHCYPYTNPCFNVHVPPTTTNFSGFGSQFPGGHIHVSHNSPDPFQQEQQPQQQHFPFVSSNAMMGIGNSPVFHDTQQQQLFYCQ